MEHDPNYAALEINEDEATAERSQAESEDATGIDAHRLDDAVVSAHHRGQAPEMAHNERTFEGEGDHRLSDQ